MVATGGQERHPGSTERLMSYWSTGAGGARISWGKPGDFDRCRALLARFVHGHELDGLCARLHHRATGAWPGHAAGEQTGKRGGKGKH